MALQVYVCALGHVWLFATPWTLAHKAPLSMEFFQARTLERVVFPPPGALPDTGIKSVSPVSPLIGRGVLYHCTKWEDCGLLRQPPNSHKQVSPPPASFGISVTPPLFDPVICFTLLQRKKT